MKKKALKFVGLQIALIATLLLTQIAIQFANTHYWVGFQSKKGDNWYSVAMTAQAYNSNCQIDLQKANEQLNEFRKIRDENNKDVY
jgi:hypothetical protein